MADVTLRSEYPVVARSPKTSPDRPLNENSKESMIDPAMFMAKASKSKNVTMNLPKLEHFTRELGSKPYASPIKTWLHKASLSPPSGSLWDLFELRW
mmetsp:Transcript_24709/g.48267  ORF Transcript_24709/g.48267 Transcript_24709/m.48267 type:complete len:97 (+) Transcript_24709:948-1238(+)